MVGTIKWKETDKQGAPLSSLEAVLNELRTISKLTTRQNGIAAVLEKPSRQMLTVIMAGPHWALDWFPEDYQGVGSYHTVAETFDPDTDNLPQHPEVATFYIFGHHSEIPIEYTVSERDALLGVEEFFTKTSRPSALNGI